MNGTAPKVRYFTATHVYTYKSGGDEYVDYPPILAVRMTMKEGTAEISIDFAAIPGYEAGNLLLVQAGEHWITKGYRFSGTRGAARFRGRRSDERTIEFKGEFSEIDRSGKPDSGFWTITMTELEEPPVPT